MQSLVRTGVERWRSSWGTNNRDAGFRKTGLRGLLTRPVNGVVGVGGKDVVCWVRRRIEVPIVFIAVDGVIRLPFEGKAAFLDQRLLFHEGLSFNSGNGSARNGKNFWPPMVGQARARSQGEEMVVTLCVAGGGEGNGAESAGS